jgi:hypothetical protein
VDVANWIKDWIWQKPPEKRKGETIVSVDREADLLAGYGTWAYVDVVGRGRQIEIAWFGVDTRYQAREDENGHKVAGLIYATVEAAALADPDSAADTPLTLACHVDNARGLQFWRRRGYHLIEDADLQIEKNLYYRMVR